MAVYDNTYWGIYEVLHFKIKEEKILKELGYVGDLKLVDDIIKKYAEKEKLPEKYPPTFCFKKGENIKNIITDILRKQWSERSKEFLRTGETTLYVPTPKEYHLSINVDIEQINIRYYCELECKTPEKVLWDVIYEPIERISPTSIIESDVAKPYYEFFIVNTLDNLYYDIRYRRKLEPERMVNSPIAIHNVSHPVIIYKEDIHLKRDYPEYVEKYRELALKAFEDYFKRVLDIEKCELTEESLEKDVYVCKVKHIPTGKEGTIKLVIQY